jgi:hypothetical protein
MSAAKSICLSLLVACFAPAAQAQISPNVHKSLLTHRPLTSTVAISRHQNGTSWTDSEGLIDQAETIRPAIPSSNWGLILLLFCALAGYQLRRNHRTLDHRLTGP